MIIVLVLLFIVLFIFCYLFFAPFYLEVNSVDNLYRVRFHKLASISLKAKNNSLFVDIKLVTWEKEIDLLAKKTNNKEKPVVKQNKNNTEIKFSWNKIKAILASFKVNKCHISVDFGNMQTNGILYPVFYGIATYTKKNIEVNFINKNEIILEIENSLARMSYAYLKSLILTTKNKKT